MKSIVLLVFSCFLCQAVVDGQPRKDKPTVYIEFERAGNREPLFARQSNTGIWLRLHNNTKWSIVLYMHGVPSAEYGDASLIYDVLFDRRVIIEDSCHACSFNSLGPGHSLLFSVPAEHLSKGHSLRIKFSYSWEDSHKVTAGSEPEHYVSFDSLRLPKSLQQSKE